MKFKNIIIIVFFVSAFSLVSCSDDENIVLQFSDGESTSFTSGCMSGIYTLNINANGYWVASISPVDGDKQPNWIGVLDKEGTGKAIIHYVVQANIDDVERAANITITSGDKTVTYTVTQNGMEPDSNDDNGLELDYSMFNGTLPIGFGMRAVPDANSIQFYSNQIFLMNNTEKINMHDQLKVVNYNSDDFVLSSLSDSLGHLRRIGANLTVNVNYATFKFKLKGSFNMFGKEDGSHYTYAVNATQPISGINLDYHSLKSKWQNPDNELLPYIFTPMFLKLHDDIEKLVRDDPQNQLNKRLEELDNCYGPLFLNAAIAGGSANLALTMENTVAKDTLAIHGELGITFSSLLSLDIKASADYLNTSMETMDKCELNIQVTGGTRSARTKLLKALMKINKKDKDGKYNSELVSEDVINALSEWADSMDLSNSRTFTCQEFALAGVWELFSDGDAKDAVKAFFRKKYPNTMKNGVKICPWIRDIEEMAK